MWWMKLKKGFANALIHMQLWGEHRASNVRRKPLSLRLVDNTQYESTDLNLATAIRSKEHYPFTQAAFLSIGSLMLLASRLFLGCLFSANLSNLLILALLGSYMTPFPILPIIHNWTYNFQILSGLEFIIAACAASFVGNIKDFPKIGDPDNQLLYDHDQSTPTISEAATLIDEAFEENIPQNLPNGFTLLASNRDVSKWDDFGLFKCDNANWFLIIVPGMNNNTVAKASMANYDLINMKTKTQRLIDFYDKKCHPILIKTDSRVMVLSQSLATIYTPILVQHMRKNHICPEYIEFEGRAPQSELLLHHRKQLAKSVLNTDFDSNNIMPQRYRTCAGLWNSSPMTCVVNPWALPAKEKLVPEKAKLA